MSTNTNLHPMLNVAIKAARAAGFIINRAALDIESVRIAAKDTNDFVTEVDKAAEDAIIQTLHEAYPDHGIWAEESGKVSGKHGGADHVWIIDPLDGTNNFIHAQPHYAVSIALAVRGRIEQAVVFDPTRNDMFCATRGRGAYLNDRRLRVGKRIALKTCMLNTGFAFRRGNAQQEFLKMINDVMGKVSAVRLNGAAALDLAYVAAGFTDAFFEKGLQPWDMAAGSLLVTEAGGLVGNLTGEADFLEQRECLAANPKIYAQLVGLLSGYSKLAEQTTSQPEQTSTPAVAEDAPY